MSEWIDTSTGNRISKTAEISGLDNITINGNVTINPLVKISVNDDSKLSIGQYCYLYPNAEIIASGEKTSIGGYVIIGRNSVVKSISIGNRVIIEDNCVLHPFSVIYDCCLIKKGTIIPEKMVIPPYSEVSGIPGKDFVIKSLHNSYKKSIELEAKQLHILNPS
ncbi:conserved hypothetical protein [Candida tropicalis MYA-3404]|uniref:Dynactin subunit 5 n=1 Tax=Candida tropicalis (strain ATCC MYA-3404 / T1) TaxID=294747 RepID=C5M518_CANTT|nr:conserved hypothetical protein [Candida tropicalis MYA-3404]EER35134.1 conserved hypothetical protein [Candida tropicalis MYA-3404]KAG4409022.1 hypothetical protein JTP64_002328 [Candida tropicalis]